MRAFSLSIKSLQPCIDGTPSALRPRVAAIVPRRIPFTAYKTTRSSSLTVLTQPFHSTVPTYSSNMSKACCTIPPVVSDTNKYEHKGTYSQTAEFKTCTSPLPPLPPLIPNIAQMSPAPPTPKLASSGSTTSSVSPSRKPSKAPISSPPPALLS